jgi:ABC-type sugar transport system ATPase subunit
MSVIELQNLKKVYDNKEVAVNDVSISISDGEFLILVGPSGCGKSTTLRMIAGLETITDGQIKIDEQVINDLPAGKRDIGMVFQNYALYPHMTVRGNLEFPLKIKKVSKSEIKDRVVEIANLVEIDELLDRYPKQLSGGQRQRVALGRAIVREPKAFLFDEPLSNLDAKLRSQMRNEIIALQRKLNITSVYVTHDQTEAMTMGDRIVIMDKGKVMQVGAPDEIYNSPSNIFVAEFIGSPKINTFSSDMFIDLIGREMPTNVTTLALRPDDISLCDFKNGKYEIVNIENLGHEYLYHISVFDKNCIVRNKLKYDISVGDMVNIIINDKSLLMFDDEGKAIK